MKDSGNIGYDPINDGDYPWYDLTNQIDCRTSRRVTFMVIITCGGCLMIKEIFILKQGAILLDGD